MHVDRDKFWNEIFSKFDILNCIHKEKFYQISRSDCSYIISEKKNLKLEDYFIFESYDSLPRIFKENGLVIIQIYKSSFIIGHYDIYIELQKFDFEPIFSKKELVVYSIDDIKNNKVNFALSLINSGILDEMIMSRDDSKMKILNIFDIKSNFARSKKNKVKIMSTTTSNRDFIKYSSINLFYDMILEDRNNVYVLKIVNEKIDSYNRMCLYANFIRIKEFSNKDVIFILLSNFDNNIVLYELIFRDENDLYSLESLNEQIFKVKVLELKEREYIEKHVNRKANCTKKTPFPQANDFEKIIKYCDLIYSGKGAINTMVEELGITTRQIKYYKNSCLYLELINVKGKEVFLVDEFFDLYKSKGNRERTEYVINKVKKDSLLSKCYTDYQLGKLTDKKFISYIQEEYDINCNTIKRRMSSIISWFLWIEKYNNRSVSYENIGVDNDVRKILFELLKNHLVTRIRFYELKELLIKTHNIDITEKELIKLTRRSNLYYSKELHILFLNKHKFYKFLEIKEEK